MKNILRITGILLIIICSLSVSAQTTKADKKAAKAADLKRIVDGKSYVFKVNQAMPMSGQMINLTSSFYDLKLANDTLTAFLPYYGVAYSAPIDQTEGGIKFTTTKFENKVTFKKNGNIQINLKPKDLGTRPPKDVVYMILTVSPGGYASLQVISVNRQSISFTGMLEEVKSNPTP